MLHLYINIVVGGQELTIIGSGFGATAKVTVSGKEVKPLYYSDTEVRLALPPLPHGNHDIGVYVEGKGLAMKGYIYSTLIIFN